MGHGLIRLAYDVGPGVGLGHRGRMEALADALAGLGHDAELTPAGDCVAGADVLVLDSYRTRADDPSVRAGRVVAVDDVGRDLAVDLVVDPAPVERPTVPRAARVLGGLRYALVGARLSSAEPRPTGGTVERVLVTTGGTDAEGLGADLARQIVAELEGTAPDVEVVLVVGPWSSPDVPEAVTGLRSPLDLGPHLAAADVVVCAAGVTLLESLTLGRPTVTFAMADNQIPYLEGVTTAGAARGVAFGEVAGAVRALVAGADARERLSSTATATADGRGADRVAEAVAALA